jgi:hypothetical protein
MVTPETVFDYHVSQKRLEKLKVQTIPSGYDASQYQTERIRITARDGVQVPVSILMKKGFKMDGSQPLHLYAYGAYGLATPPDFAANRLSLVDRGFAYAIAHVRGGDDLGYQWYLDGKLQKRTNTFNDFVDAAKGLIEKRYTSKSLITASGGSAVLQLCAERELRRCLCHAAPRLSHAARHPALPYSAFAMLRFAMPLPRWALLCPGNAWRCRTMPLRRVSMTCHAIAILHQLEPPLAAVAPLPQPAQLSVIEPLRHRLFVRLVHALHAERHR